jgi:hypothetical protein
VGSTWEKDATNGWFFIQPVPCHATILGFLKADTHEIERRFSQALS